MLIMQHSVDRTELFVQHKRMVGHFRYRFEHNGVMQGIQRVRSPAERAVAVDEDTRILFIRFVLKSFGYDFACMIS